MIDKTYSGRGYRLTITGGDATKKKLASLMLANRELFKQALKIEGQEIYQEAFNRAPEMTGALKESGKVVDGLARNGDENSYEVRVGFGGKNINPVTKTATSKYARYQHETNPRRPKYLENPFMEAIAGMPTRIAQRMKLYKG